jgi:hypothetical protein
VVRAHHDLGDVHVRGARDGGSRRRSNGDVLAEVKRVLIGYLGPVLAPPPGAAEGRVGHPVDGRRRRGETGPDAGHD